MRARVSSAAGGLIVRIACAVVVLTSCASVSAAAMEPETAAISQPGAAADPPSRASAAALYVSEASIASDALHRQFKFGVTSRASPFFTPLPATKPHDTLPDAPRPGIFDDSEIAAARATDPSNAVKPVQQAEAALPGSPAPRVLTPAELAAGCQSGELRGKQCNFHWLPALWEAFEATAIENMGNVALDSDTRNALTTHDYWGAYVFCVEQYRFNQWSDDTTFLVHDIGHPMQGASVYAIYDQNDPKLRGMLIQNTKRYWIEHLKAMAFVTGYEIQWKLGPASEAAIGNSGYNTYYTPRVIGRSTNETGFQDFFITPVYGLGWHITEDLVDRFVMPHIWKHTHNKGLLTALLPITPCRDAANILRYKPFYYRDYPLTPLK